MITKRLRGFRGEFLKINRENSSNAKNFRKRKKKIAWWDIKEWTNRKIKKYWKTITLLVDTGDIKENN